MSKRSDEDHPSKLGRFEVKELIGRGGMGVVFLAEDPVIGRPVAIKVVHADPGLKPEEREELQARFEQEFRSAGTLSHPNLVTVYDVGNEEDCSFIAMEYVDGESLAELLSAGRVLSFKEIADLAMEIASGLDYAHQKGVIHRDVKPGNILITKEGRPKVTDFGVAKLASTHLTRTGTMIGTPSYMSPEQVTGQPIAGTSDQFCMAVILYQMFTGELPFNAENPTTILYKIVHENPIGPHQLNPSLPEPLDLALMRALGKNPHERYPSCTALAEAVREALGAVPSIPVESTQRTVTLSQTPVAPGSGTYGEAMSWWQRQSTGPRIGLFAAGAVLLLGIGWWTASTLQRPRDAGAGAAESSPAREAAVAPAPEPFTGRIRVRTDRPGAAIWLDGEETGLEAPSELTLDGTVGDPVHLELRRAGHTVADIDVVLGPAMDPVWEAIERPLPAETFTIRSEPPGARVTLNGTLLEGPTPVEVELRSGEDYVVVAELEGHDSNRYAFSFPDDLRPQSREARSLFFPLTPSRPPGILVIDADYAVEVEVAGRRYTQHEIPLPPGSYDVQISAPEVFYSRRVPDVSIQSNKPSPLKPPIAVEVQISAFPANCRVYIDGRFAGEIPFRQRLAAGRHKIRFEWPAEGRSRELDEVIRPGTRQIFGTLE